MSEYTSKIFVTVDIAVFRTVDNQLEILLIQRKNEPFKNQYALPGGFVDADESIEQAAIRELEEETSVKVSKIKQFGAYGNPNRDPRGYMVSIAYLTKVSPDTQVKAADDAKNVKWFKLNNLPELAFDHKEIIKDAVEAFLHQRK